MQPEHVITHNVRQRPDLLVVQGVKSYPLVATLAAMALLLAMGWLATRAGSAVTPDSVQYLSTAHHVARGDGVWTSITELTVDDPSIPFGPWPPLYPASIGALMTMGISPFAAPRILNLSFLVLGVAALAWVAYRARGSRIVTPVVLIHSLMFYPVMTASFAWSEPMYILLSLLSLGFIAQGLERERKFPWQFAVAGLLAGLAMLCRYMGFTLILGGGVGLFLLLMHKPWRYLLRDLLMFGVPAALPNALWLARNRSLTGYIFGEKRPDGWFTWDQILVDSGKSFFLDWASPILRHPESWATAVGIIGVVGAVLVAKVFFVRLADMRFAKNEEPSGFSFVLWVYFAVYVLAMIALSRRVGLDPVNTRYLAPIYPVFLVLIAVAFDAVLRGDRRNTFSRWAKISFGGGLAAMLLAHAAATGVFIAHAGEETRTVTRPYWTSTLWDDAGWDSDPGLMRMMEGDKGTLVISNVWDFVGIRTGLDTKPLPEITWERYPDRLFDFPGALIAVHTGMRAYRATADDLFVLVQDGRLIHLGNEGAWAFFRVPGRERVSS